MLGCSSFNERSEVPSDASNEDDVQEISKVFYQTQTICSYQTKCSKNLIRIVKTHDMYERRAYRVHFYTQLYLMIFKIETLHEILASKVFNENIDIHSECTR